MCGRFGAVIFVLFVCSGCTTAHVSPSIEDFSEAVSTITTADLATPRSKSLAARIAEQRRKDLAAVEAQYVPLDALDEVGCQYNQPALREGSFAESCQLVPFIRDPQTREQIQVASEYDTAAAQQAAGRVIAAGDQSLLKEQLAAGLQGDLLYYAEQLNTLSTATEPADIAASAGNAIDAVRGLSDTLQRENVAAGSPRATQRANTRSLVTLLAQEALEAWRYRLLRNTVIGTNEIVDKAARQLAILEFEREKQGLQIHRDAFASALDNLAPGSASDLKLVEDTRAALVDADKKASFRRYRQIAEAHQAIVEALKDPADIERLTAAKNRIVALAEAIKAVK